MKYAAASSDHQFLLPCISERHVAVVARCRERGFLDTGNFSGVKFHECETLSAEVLERRADEIDVLVVDDEEPVVKGLVVPHGKLWVLGVEGRNVGRGFPSGPEAAICDFKSANSNALNWNMNPDGNLSMLRLTCSLRRFTGTPYSSAKSRSSMTCTPRNWTPIPFVVSDALRGRTTAAGYNAPMTHFRNRRCLASCRRRLGRASRAQARGGSLLLTFQIGGRGSRHRRPLPDRPPTFQAFRSVLSETQSVSTQRLIKGSCSYLRRHGVQSRGAAISYHKLTLSVYRKFCRARKACRALEDGRRTHQTSTHVGS